MKRTSLPQKTFDIVVAATRTVLVFGNQEKLGRNGLERRSPLETHIQRYELLQNENLPHNVWKAECDFVEKKCYLGGYYGPENVGFHSLSVIKMSNHTFRYRPLSNRVNVVLTRQKEFKCSFFVSFHRVQNDSVHITDKLDTALVQMSPYCVVGTRFGSIA